MNGITVGWTVIKPNCFVLVTSRKMCFKQGFIFQSVGCLQGHLPCQVGIKLLKRNIYVEILFCQGNYPPSSVFVLSFVFQTGKRVGKLLHSSLQTVLDEEEKLGTTRKKVGFLG